MVRHVNFVFLMIIFVVFFIFCSMKVEGLRPLKEKLVDDHDSILKLIFSRAHGGPSSSGAETTFLEFPLILEASAIISTNHHTDSSSSSAKMPTPLSAGTSAAKAAAILLSLLAVIPAAELASDLTTSRRPPQNRSLCDELIRPAGYLCSEHTVQTKDGHLLGIQRVSSGDEALRLGFRPPVLLQHGLFTETVKEGKWRVVDALAGDSWFLNSKDQSLGFILADQGFDVWVGNVRGTRWSHGHASLSEKDKEYWNWSWEELALYDLAEMINYVYLTTNSKISYVGHSQGTIIALAAFTQPDIVKMVDAVALLCPISYLEHISARLVLRMVSIHLDQMILAMGIHQLNFRSDFGVNILDSLCDGHLDCSDMLSALTVIRKGTFSKYDYGLWKNIQKYGVTKPLAFDLSRIPESLPIWMGYGGSDGLADLTDFQRTLKELRCKPELLYLENYGHIDFVLGTNAKEDVYDHMIRFFRSIGKSSSY
ncbi:Triacylglycerol lipase 1-like protein [Drosera capensis]